MTRKIADLDYLFTPRSVAIIGASSDPTRIGGRPLAYLKKAAYQGGVYPVNPARTTVQGLPCFPSIAAVPHAVDVAIIAVRGDEVLDSARACAACGVRSLIVFTAGFAEIGADGIASQEALAEIGRSAGMRIVGPNSLGSFNARSRAFVTFSATVEACMPDAGRVSIATQSGGYGGYVLMMAQDRGIDIGNLIATGNECDVELGEVVQWLAADAGTDVILMYMEGCSNGASLIAGFEAARNAGKPIALIKVGSTEAGAQAAISHTAALAGSDDTFDEVFKKYGVYRARHTEELLDIAFALRAGKLPRNRSIGLVTVSGGLEVHMSDLAAEAGLDLAPLSAEAQAKIRSIVPFASTRNPVDVTGQVNNDSTVLERCLEVILQDENYGSILIFIGVAGSVPSLANRLNHSIAEIARRFPDRLIACCTTSKDTPGPESGVLYFLDPPRAIGALKACAFFADQRAAPAVAAGSRTSSLRELPLFEYGRRYNEHEAKQILTASGLVIPVEKFAATTEEVAAAATAIKGRVSVKIVSRDIMHKSDVGGVALDIDGPDAARKTAADMLMSVHRGAPSAVIDGFLVSEMVSGVECMVGIFPDPIFGPVLLLGAGGIAAELLRDMSRRVAPVSAVEAQSMIRELRTFPLLDGYRERPKADIGALARAIVRISELAHANADRIEAFEINPLIVRPAGRGVVALDCVLATRRPH